MIKRVIDHIAAQVEDIPFSVEYWDGDTRNYGTGPARFVVEMKDKKTCERMLANISLRAGEAYASGAIDVRGDLQDLICLIYRYGARDFSLSWLEKLRRISAWRPGKSSRRQAKKDVTHHYDVGNEFYRLWLGEAMAYSCAYFKTAEDDIDLAQEQKFRHICEKLRLAAGQRVLDIGCGWGGFAVFAATHYGVEVLGVTLSEPQAEIARERVAANRLGDLVRIEVRDYRDLQPARPFDGIVSIGMLEHVGGKGYQEYFQTHQRLLAVGGIGVLHTIGRTLRVPEDPWITKHIFPGLHLPTLAELSPPMGGNELKITDLEVLRMHYALTLDRWSEAFERNVDAIRQMYDESFVRKWRFYLRGCAASFRYGDSCLFQIQFTRGLKNDLPLTRDYLYREADEELAKQEQYAMS